MVSTGFQPVTILLAEKTGRTGLDSYGAKSNGRARLSLHLLTEPAKPRRQSPILLDQLHNAGLQTIRAGPGGLLVKQAR